MRLALLTALLLALSACGQSTTEQASAPEAPAPVDMAQSTGGNCTSVEALTDTVGFESVGAIAGHTISAEPRTVVCSEPALDAVECAVTGPTSIRVEQGQTITNYTLAAGQSGTLTVGPAGPACYLNANGG